MGNARGKPVCDFETGLSENCWQLVMSHLDVVSQLSLAMVSRRLCEIFKRYARQRYRHLDEQVIRQLSPSQLEQLLQLVGDGVRNYVQSSPGDELDTLYRPHFDLILRYCKRLERFAFFRLLLTPEGGFELTHQLEKLQHLFLRTEATALRSQLLAGLAKVSQLETLLLRGPELSEQEIEEVCRISSLKELDFYCTKKLSMEHLLQLSQLETLHISGMLELENEELLQLVKGLVKLQTLHVNECPRITLDFVRQARVGRDEEKPKLRIYFHKSGIDWIRLHETTDGNVKSSLLIINKPQVETESSKMIRHQLNRPRRQESLQQIAGKEIILSKEVIPRQEIIPRQEFSKVQMALLPRDYPKVHLSHEELCKLEESILDEMESAEWATPLIFTGIHCRTGHLVVDCKDQQTANWLFEVGASLKTWTGISLCVKLNDDVPLPYTFTAFCAMSANRTNEGILALLENQNKLDTSLWKIVARRNEGGGALLTIGIDGTGREGIEALNYQLAFRFGKITVSGLRKSRADDSLKEPSKFSEE